MGFQLIASNPNPDKLALFAAYADDHPNVWSLILNYKIAHNKFGCGIITKLNFPIEDAIHVIFDSPTESTYERRFSKVAFLNGYFTLIESQDISNEFFRITNDAKKIYEIARDEFLIEERIRQEIEEKKHREESERLAHLEEMKLQQERELLDTKHFTKLKSKYLVENYDESTPTSRLYIILLKIESDELLTKEEIKWCEDRDLFTPLAIYYENFTKQEHFDPWCIVLAGSNWRKAGYPERALEISNGFFATDEKLNSAVLVNRGGALKDLYKLSEAKDIGLRVIKTSPKNFYAYNLLGAVCYQNGEPDEGDRYFGEAIKLGAQPKDVDKNIKESIKKAEKDEQVFVAQYLLSKDPQKYKWAEYYLRNNIIFP